MISDDVLMKYIYCCFFKQGLVFDVKMEDVATVVNGFKDVISDESESVEKINELPNIQEEEFGRRQFNSNRSYDRYSSGQRNRNSFEHRSRDNSRLHELYGQKSRHGHRDMYANRRHSSDDSYRSNFHNRYNKRSRDQYDFSDDDIF